MCRLQGSLFPHKWFQKPVENEGNSGTNYGSYVCSFPKKLEKRLETQEIKGRIEIIQRTTLSRSARVFKRVLEINRTFLSLRLQSKTSIVNWSKNHPISKESWRLEETCCHSNSSEKPSANVDVENYNESIE